MPMMGSLQTGHAEERISELEDILLETCTTEKVREIKTEKKKERTKYLRTVGQLQKV